MKHTRVVQRLITGLCLIVTMGAAAQVALAQGTVFAFPKSGQSEEQQAQDQFTCHQWAVRQTGFDPMQQPQTQVASGYSTPAPTQSGGFGSGGVVRDGARGAALGAIGGAIAGDAGEGAAYGAAAGALFGSVRRNSRKHEQAQWEQQQQAQRQAQEQQMAAQYQQGMGLFNQAFAACMRAKDYEVQ